MTRNLFLLVGFVVPMLAASYADAGPGRWFQRSNSNCETPTTTRTRSSRPPSIYYVPTTTSTTTRTITVRTIEIDLTPIEVKPPKVEYYWRWRNGDGTIREGSTRASNREEFLRTPTKYYGSW